MLTEFLSNPIFLQSIVLALFSAVACGIIGTFVVLKRISNISGSVAHAAFGGIGIAMFLGVPPMAGAVAVGWLAGLVMAWIRTRYRENEDFLISLVWVGGMAVGLLFLHFSQGYTSDLFGFLFGNILLSTWSDVISIAGWDLLLLIAVTVGYRLIQLVTFDELFATVGNLPVKRVYFALISSVAVTTVLLIKAVGILLVIALLSVPAAIATRITRRLSTVMLASGFIAGAATMISVMVSFIWDIPVAPMVILILITAYFLVGVVAKR